MFTPIYQWFTGRSAQTAPERAIKYESFHTPRQRKCCAARHTGRSLRLPWQAHAALAMIVLATAVRALPELGIGTFLLGMHYGLAAMIWSGAFALWLFAFIPMLRNPLGDALH